VAAPYLPERKQRETNDGHDSSEFHELASARVPPMSPPVDSCWQTEVRPTADSNDDDDLDDDDLKDDDVLRVRLGDLCGGGGAAVAPPGVEGWRGVPANTNSRAETTQTHTQPTTPGGGAEVEWAHARRR
jgi:hypothetical protein